MTTASKSAAQSGFLSSSAGSNHAQTFTQAKQAFDIKFSNATELPQSLVPVDGKIITNISLKDAQGKPNEEYYKWQFISAIMDGGLCFPDYIGAEIHFPKGNPKADPLKIDACIFDSKDWLIHYKKWRANRHDIDALEFLRDHCVAAIEFKRGKDDIATVFSNQLRPAMKEPDVSYVLGVIYDAERMYLFQRKEGNKKIVRYDETKNKGDGNVIDLSLNLPDSYLMFPRFDELIKNVNGLVLIDKTNRSINELDIITSRSSVQFTDALSNILIAMEAHGMVSQTGYEILIQILAMKIFDEKRNKEDPSAKLRFYALEPEVQFKWLHETEISNFINRMKLLYDEASERYPKILEEPHINWTVEAHVRVSLAIVRNFQDYSLERSAETDLYQLVFYNFAHKFQKDHLAQFLTPLPLIKFLVDIVNPRGSEKLCDPCVGIADFLSLSYIYSDPKLKDSNLYGLDLDKSMLALAQLNMLLNGDGNANLLYAKDDGSLLYKVRNDGTLDSLVHSWNKYDEKKQLADWDHREDNAKLMKFDIVLTNPPFGEGRPYEASDAKSTELLEMYETYWRKGEPKAMDKGVLFLENAYHILKENGRFAVVLSNSIASEEKSAEIIDWLLERMRVVAVFDLPPNVFAETGVNTTLIVAYKPAKQVLEQLVKNNYAFFPWSFQKVGYERKTKKRNVVFEDKFRIDPLTFEVMIDENGAPIRDEEFSEIVKQFREWTRTQEEDLQRLFVL